MKWKSCWLKLIIKIIKRNAGSFAFLFIILDVILKSVRIRATTDDASPIEKSFKSL
jgi:hypothetical protein